MAVESPSKMRAIRRAGNVLPRAKQRVDAPKTATPRINGVLRPGNLSPIQPKNTVFGTISDHLQSKCRRIGDVMSFDLDCQGDRGWQKKLMEFDLQDPTIKDALNAPSKIEFHFCTSSSLESPTRS